MSHTPADFRSDTVTRPTPAMRRAMAEAVVGDDVFGEDPTANELEAEAARLFHREASVFVPTGCMGNQIAARLHASPGEEAVVESAAHMIDWELAGLAALAGIQARPLASARGCLDPDTVRATLRPAGGFRPRCALLLLENTHNFHGGAVVPIEHLQKLHAVARERGAKVHLDGARLWNASVASGTPLPAYGAVADSITVCLSKGLGAPIGSLLVGDTQFIARAREARKLLGGGMRQVGVIAAAGLVALRTMRSRLVDDHHRARRLADGLTAAPRTTLPTGAPDTNIVIVRIADADAKGIAQGLRQRGILALPAGPDRIRFVTHLDVDDDDVIAAIAAFQETVAEITRTS
jgi:threonine aldolase